MIESIVVAEAKSRFEELHRRPELSGEEQRTARTVAQWLRECPGCEVLCELGGHGVAAVFSGVERGPTVLLRCELDALPIAEKSGLSYASEYESVAHLCGHDGHMAILLAVARVLGNGAVARGKTILLFQPAEETGAGAMAVIEDDRFRSLEPDFVYGLHNVPGLDLGKVVLFDGTFCCASRGLAISLQGRPAHAAQPETGASPVRATRKILEGLELLASDRETFVTVVGVRIGAEDYGVTPGDGEIFLTLRARTDSELGTLHQSALDLVDSAAQRDGLAWSAEVHDDFPATVNHREEVERLQQVAGERSLVVTEPFRWSEDFGHFLVRHPGAFFGLGSGKCAALHDRAYVFPKELIELGAQFWLDLLQHHWSESYSAST